MINSNMSVDSSQYSSSGVNTCKTSSIGSSNLFGSVEANNEDEVNFSEKIKDFAKKEHESNKEFAKDMFNSYTQGKNGKFSFGKTCLNTLLMNAAGPLGYMIGGLNFVGNFISHKINSDHN